MGLMRAFEALITNLYFLFTPHNEKSLTGMRITPLAVHSRLAPPLVDERSYSRLGGVPVLLLELERNAGHPLYVPFYDSLARCAVTSVAHMRSKKKQHELILVEFTLTLPSGASDTRVLRIERAREQDLVTRRIPESSAAAVEPSCLRERTTLFGTDLVAIADSLERVLPPCGDYRAVQTLSALPVGTLDILDVLALAGALDETAAEYSVLRYMCMWYAAAVFRLLRERAPADAYARGPAYADAGTGKLGGWLSTAIRLVEVNSAALVWPGAGPAAERRMEAAYEAVYHRRLATPARREDFRAQLHDALAHDAALVRERTPTLIDMRAAAGVVVPDIRTKLRQLSEQTELAKEREQRTEAAERNAQSDRKARLAAEADRLAAETDRLAAETDRLAAEADRLAAEAEIAHLKHLLDAANSAQHSR